MADKYDFAVVVDETIGNFINIAVLDCADIVVSSLTKIFSGASNVMGGRYPHLLEIPGIFTVSCFS
jgi:cystathionine gamma-synthase